MKNLKLPTGITFCVIILIYLGLALFFSIKNQTRTKISNSSTQITILSDDSYQKLEAHLLSIVDTKDPRAALFELAQDMKTNDQIAAVCHPIAHDIGHAAFKKYHDFGLAMSFQNEICNSGYLHGVIESDFSQTNNLYSEMSTICQNYPPKSFTSWECFHGVGHGVMYYSSNDLPLSLSSCGIYQNQFNRESCINGVFMENFNTDQKIHPSKFLKATDPFYPCPEESSFYKSDCYLYAPTYFLQLHPGKYADALNLCLSIESGYSNICTQGVGAQTIKENINNPQIAEALCLQGKSSQVEPCIQGMVGLYINYYGSLEPAKILCTNLQKSNQEICQNAIAETQKIFTF